jgi:predicted DNA-binding transcriptional regulator AlpA
MSPEFVREAELVKRFSISAATIRRRIAAGQFPAPVRFGRQVRLWLASEIEAFAAQLALSDRSPHATPIAPPAKKRGRPATPRVATRRLAQRVPHDRTAQP